MIQEKGYYLKDFKMKHQRKFLDYLFQMNYNDDPSEIIVKSIRANEIYKNIVPSINGIICNNDKIFFSCENEQQLYYKKIFDKEECYRCGQFIGKVHSYKFSYFGNLYNLRKDNVYFCEHLKQTYDFLVINNRINRLQEECYLEKQKSSLNLYSTLVCLKPKCEDILFDKEGNVYGYRFVDKMIIMFPKLELVSWKKVLTDKFKYFLEGYLMYANYNYEEDERDDFYYELINLRCK